MKFKDILDEEPTTTTTSVGNAASIDGDAAHAKKIGPLLRRHTKLDTSASPEEKDKK
jgi:hypothetical protein